MAEPIKSTCDHVEKLREYRADLEEESHYKHWSPDQLYIFKLVKKWFDQTFGEM